MMAFEIAGRKVGPSHPPFIIAEMSANHGGDLERARRIVHLAAEAGADAIKFQVYTADSITLDSSSPGFLIEGESLWTGRRLHNLYAEASTPYEWFPELFALSRELGIIPFASPFDLEAVRLLEKLDAPAYKIASFEAVDLELIAACARTGKPVIISTGMCRADDVSEAITAARGAGGNKIAILKCTSSYPATPAAANLLTISAMAERFDVCVGVSDHTLGTSVSVAACALGACLVEKHFIDTPEPPTADSAFSLGPVDLRRLVVECREAFEARGNVHYGPFGAEERSLQFRRSLYAVRDIKRGEKLDRDNVRSVRPCYGLAPKHLPEVIGKRAAKDIPFATPLAWDLLE
jgi:N-acetylneuraminate synthase